MWNSLWYLQGGGGTTGLVLLGGAVIVEPLEAELQTTELEATVMTDTLEAQLVEPLEAEVQ